jgi:hypothetical protein
MCDRWCIYDQATGHHGRRTFKLVSQVGPVHGSGAIRGFGRCGQFHKRGENNRVEISRLMIIPSRTRKRASGPLIDYDPSSTSKAQQNVSLSSRTRPLPSGAHIKSLASNFSADNDSSLSKLRSDGRTYSQAHQCIQPSLPPFRPPRPTHRSMCTYSLCHNTPPNCLSELDSIEHAESVLCA